MDVYHKVLTRVYELSEGRDSVDVDLSDVTKKEGFFPSIDDITHFLAGESWVTETPRKYVVRITHWGAAEAKKTLSNTPDKALAVTKDSNKTLAETKEFVIMLEEFATGPSSAKLDVIEKRYAEIGVILERIRSNI